MKTFNLDNLNPSEMTTANLIAESARELGVIRIEKNGHRVRIDSVGTGFEWWFNGHTAELKSKKELRAQLAGFRW